MYTNEHLNFTYGHPHHQKMFYKNLPILSAFTEI